jgi:hypothetical protein
MNRPKFTGALATLADPWLAWMTGCATNTDPHGPAVGPGEVSRVRCSFGNTSVYFVQYADLAARDKARTQVLGQNIDAKTLTPGAKDPVERTTRSHAATGQYIEHAYKLTTGESAGKTISGLWWDDKDRPVAGYLLAYWSDLGGNWEPLRNVWDRTA